MNKHKNSLNHQEGNIVLGLLIGAVLALIPSYYFYSKYQQTQRLLKNPQAVAQEQTQDVVNKVSKLMALPAGENPTIATVQDKTKLKDQPFFKNAENGDKLLLYINARKAILYRDNANKIIEVAPINISRQGQTAGTNTTTPAPSQGAAQPTVVPSKAATQPQPTVAR